MENASRLHTWLSRAGLSLLIIFFSLFYSSSIFDKPGLHGDSIKFQYLGAIAGVPHPTGYPLYVSISHLFSSLPVKSLAFRMNLLSFLFALGSLALLYVLIHRLTDNILCALTLTFFTGLTNSFRTYACIAEVYTLHAFLLVWLFHTAVSWRQKATEAKLILILFISSLTLLHHMLIVTVVPGMVYLLWNRRKEIVPSKRLIRALAAIMLFYFCVHGSYYIFIRSGPVYMDYAIPNLSRYLGFLLGAGHQQWLLRDITFSSLGTDLAGLYEKLLHEWGTPFMFFLVVGLLWTIGKRAATGIFFAINFIFWYLLCSQYNIPDIDQYFVHGTIAAATVIACLFADMLKTVRGKRLIPSAIGFIPIVAIGPLIGQTPEVLVHYRYAEPGGFRDLLKQAPDRAVIQPVYYDYEQVLRYYSVTGGHTDKDILQFRISPEQIRDYLTEGTPFNSRGKEIPAGRSVYVFRDYAEYERLGLSVNPLTVPPDAAIAETFAKRLLSIGDRKIVAVVSNNTAGYALPVEVLEGFSQLGLDLQPTVDEWMQMAAIGVIGGFEWRYVLSPRLAMIGIQKETNFHGMDMPVTVQCASRSGEKYDESFIEVNGKRYLENVFGLSFVIIGMESGEVEDVFMVNAPDTIRIFPFTLAQVTAGESRR